MLSTPLASTYRKPLWTALLLSLAFGILCALMLDGGFLGRRCGVALLAFWIGVALVIVRRPLAPSRLDVAYIRWGFLFVFALAVVLSFAIVPWR